MVNNSGTPSHHHFSSPSRLAPFAMDVQLYIYDLSKGFARTASTSLLGVKIDAIYHTSIVLENIEYVYDGGIKRVAPGRTHLGMPMEIQHLGTTSLPMEVIQEYLESLKDIYTAQVGSPVYPICAHSF